MNEEAENRDQTFDRYRHYLGLLARVQISPRLRGKIDLSGVVQQTLLEAHQAHAQTQGWNSTQEIAWMRRLLANNLADEIRKFGAAKRDLARERSLEAALNESSSRLQAWLAADQSSPSQQVERQEESLRLAAALARLPETQQEALVLQHWQGWTLAEIAEHMGKSKTAVAGLLKRGLQQLRVEMGKE